MRARGEDVVIKRRPFRTGDRQWLIALFCIAGIAGLFLFFCPVLVHADGGAPNLAYVAGTASGVSVIDVRQRKVTRTLSVPGNPSMVLLSQDGSLLTVSEPQQGRIAVLNATTGQTMCTASIAGQPSLLAFDLNTNLLYVAGHDAALVTALDPTTCQVKFTIHTDGDVAGLAVVIISSGITGSAGDQLWVAAQTLSGYDDLNGQQIANVPVSGEPRYITIPPGETIYVTTGQGSVDAVDISTHKVKTLITGGRYGPMDYDATTDEVYVPDQLHQQLVVLNPVTISSTSPREPNRVIPLAAAPQSVAITSDGQLGFAALSNGNVAMLDIPGRKLVTTIAVGGMPQFIITGLYPPPNDTSSQPTTTDTGTVSTTHIIGIISIVVFIVSLLLLLFLLTFFIIRRIRDRHNT